MSEAEHNNVTELAVQNLDALVDRQRSNFRAEGEVTYATRIDRLKRLKALIVENKTEFATTTKREFNGARFTNSVCSRSLHQRSKPSTTR